MPAAILNPIFSLARRFGVDKSIAYSSGARVVQAFTGLASVFLVAAFLTKTEQGFYYTFGSIVAIQVFFELGLSNIITQYVAHEASRLTWRDSVTLEGEPKSLSRLAHLVRFSVRWYAIIALLFFAVLLSAGYWFFTSYSHTDEPVRWFVPWLLVCVGSAGTLFMSPILAILFGLEKVREVSKMRFLQQCIVPLVTWTCLICDLRLYALGLSYVAGMLFSVVYCIGSSLAPIVWKLWREQVTERVAYMAEIFPYQWKIALSWVSGYFIFQLFNPVLFATEGAVVAGQMGMTLVVINGIMAFCQNWITTKVPMWSRLIALKDYAGLDRIFGTTMRQLSIVCLGLIAVMLAGIGMLRMLDMRLGYRFLDWLPMILMLIPLYINQWVNGWATYLRCHKQEPFLLNSIVGGVLCCVSALVLGRSFGVIGLTAGYCAITVVLSFWGHHIYVTCKRDWHE